MQANTLSQQELEKLAKDWVAKELAPANNYEIKFLNPNQKLNFAQCTSPLDIHAVGDKPLLGRLNLKVSCLTEDWFTYLGINIEVFAKVAVAKQHLGRGARLTPQLLELKEMPTSNLKGDYFTNLVQLNGKKLKTGLRAGRVITTKALELALAVNKGDLVTLSSTKGRLKVHIKVEAQNNGRIGQQIRVRNLQTGKQLKVVVIGQGEVEAL